MALRFSQEIRAGEVIVLVGAVAAMIGAWNNVSSELGLIKQSQAAQATQLREVKDESREQGQAIRRVEDKLNRARL